MAVALRGDRFEREERIGPWWWVTFYEAFFKAKG